MYDPEENLKFERFLLNLNGKIKEAAERFGEEHPITKFFTLMGEGIEELENLRNDQKNCFDEEEKKKILKETNELMATLIDSMELARNTWKLDE